MKLGRVQVRNYRSFVVRQNEKTPALELGDGLNIIVGPNNCGKSNLLRAVALALEGGTGSSRVAYDPITDQPRQLGWSFSIITVTFRSEGRTSVERTLLRYLEELERDAGAKDPFACRGEIRFRVDYRRNEGRAESFAIAGPRTGKGDPRLRERALEQFRKCVRFVYLRSGESLGEFLKDAFSEILNTVLRENLAEEYEAMTDRRARYLRELGDGLFAPLGKHVAEQLQKAASEIEGVRIAPYLPALDEIVSNADIGLTDSAETALIGKGAGVRGAVLVALAGFLAKNSKRSIVLAIEEPESFLHPQAQESLRSELRTMAQRRGVSLLMTTHSPFMLDRDTSTTISELHKALSDGRTEIGTSVQGDESLTSVMEGLFGQCITPSALDAVEPLRSRAASALFVEGFTDREYLIESARLLGKTDAIRTIDIRSAGGAHKAALDYLLFERLTRGAVPQFCLLDYDDLGKKARELLTSRYNVDGRSVLSYRDALHVTDGSVVEAEDLFSQRLLEGFVRAFGDKVLTEKVRRTDGSFHYGFTQNAKRHFMAFLHTEAGVADLARWGDLIDLLVERMARS